MSRTTTSETQLPVASFGDLAERVEWAAQAVVMLDNRDLPALAKLAKGLREIGAAFSVLTVPVAGQAATIAESQELISVTQSPEREAAIGAAVRLERIILETSSDPAADLEAVCETITSLQAVLNRQRAPRQLDEKVRREPEASTGAENEKRGATDAGGRGGASSRGRSDVIDDELFAAYIAQQQLVLLEIDEAVLSYEKDGAPGHLATLRRVIHTMKGEAGVCGLSDISTACHQVEDYLELGVASAGKRGVSADVLFAFKDWLERAIEAHSGGRVPESLGDLLTRPAAAREHPAAAAAATPLPVMVFPSEVAAAAGGTPPAATPVMADASPTVPIADLTLAADFVGEAQEHFDSADENLLRLETDPTNRDAIGAVFRAFHTIKGVSGFIGLTPIGELAHEAEALLDDVRKDRLAFKGPVVDVTFRALDMLKQMLADLGVALKAGEGFPVRAGLADMLGQLQRVRDGAAVADAADSISMSARVELQSATGGCRPGASESVARSDDGEAVLAAQTEASAGHGSAVVKPTMKVETEKIDLLLDTIGELVITETIVAEDADIKRLRSHRADKTLAQLSKITRSLQDMGMAMRMVPVEATFRKMARLVRDLAVKSGKHVEFATEGQETEIDKGMIEKLGDPLVHMVRNSVDHGLEPSQERVARGKPAAGHVTLRAFHHGGSIHIQIADDGRGLDRAAIIAKAMEKGLIESGDTMTDQDVFALIFQAGFSTAKQVTEISGRGVGMDVVRRNVEALRGKVLIQSTPGAGSVFTIVLPLTMAIIDGMQVRVGHEVFVIPTLSIIEVVNPAAGSIATVEGKGEMMLFRNTLLPLFRVDRLFNVATAHTESRSQIVVVVEDAGRHVGFVVEELLGQQQTVIKNLGAAMGTVPGISGASIMADGRPGLIVDVSGVVKLAQGAA